jgi:Sec-independent protein translocase protein TatA
MEFLNIGGLELFAILVIAFIVLGPDRITKFGKDLGIWVRKLNKNETFRDVVQTTDEIRNYPRKIFQDAMLEEPIIPGTLVVDPEMEKREESEPHSRGPESPQSNQN